MAFSSSEIASLKHCDRWIAGNSQNEISHYTVKAEKVELRTFSTSVGLIKHQYPAYCLQNKGDFLTFTLNLNESRSKSNTPIVFEIVEIHQRNHNAFGYTVLVNDFPVYFRTYEELLNSPMSYFIAIDRAKIANLSQLKITIRSASNSPFQISQVIGYGNFYEFAEDQKILNPLQIFPFLDQNTSLLSKVKTRFGVYQNFKIGAMIGLPYLSRTNQQISNFIKSTFNLALNENLPFAIMPAQWWSYTCGSSDGLGGYFGDLKYNQILYNPFSRNYHATTPNQWSNTPWPSMSSCYFNLHSAERAQFTAQLTADQYSLMQLSRETMPLGSIVMEWGSGYWMNGDFSYECVQAAAQEGVKLDPTDGLCFKEKEWMQRHIANYNNLRALAYRKGLGSNAILVNQGKLSFPQEQFSNHIYTHCLQSTLYPSFDDRVPGWVGGVSEYMWPSSEMYEFTDQRHNEYSIQYGKLSCVNLEMTMLQEEEFSGYLRTCYQNGMDFLVIFNDLGVSWDVETQIKSADSLNALPISKTPEYMRQVFDLDYTRDHRKDLISNPQNGIRYKGIRLISNNQNSIVVAAENPDLPGEILYTFEDPEKFETGLKLYIEAFVSLEDSISIHAGESLEALDNIGYFTMEKKRSWFNRCSLNIFDLSDKAKGKNKVFVKVTINGGEEIGAIGAVKAYLPWNQKSGPIGFRNDTYDERRVQNSWIQNRVLAERLLSEYRLKKGSDDEVSRKAKNELLSGNLMGPISNLNRSISELLPARFAVKGFGPLGNYPINVQLSEPEDRVVVKLLSYSPQKSEIEFFADKEVTVLLKYEMGSNARYLVNKIGENRYQIEKNETTGLNAELKFEVKPPHYKSLIEGKIIEGKVILESPQGVEIEAPGHGVESIFVPFHLAALFKRKQHQGGRFLANARPQKNDRVTLKINSNGEAIEIDADYGKISGAIKNFITPKLQEKNPHNGIVELEDGSKYELSFNKDHTFLKIGALNDFAISYDVNQVFEAIKPGIKVEMNYAPISFQGRPYRLISLFQIRSN